MCTTASPSMAYGARMTTLRCPVCGGRLDEYESMFRAGADGETPVKGKRLSCDDCGGYFTEELEPVDDFEGTTE
jgi:predicted RNA-binding Zn-ribbon protein involved in translation (DUF1610 family)